MSATNWNEILGWSDEQIEDLRFVGFAYLKQGKYDIAIGIFEALVILSSKTAYDFQTLGALYLEVGENLKALNTIEQALQFDPDHSSTLLNRTKALFSLGYRRQAIAQARQLEHVPDSFIANQASALLLSYA